MMDLTKLHEERQAAFDAFIQLPQPQAFLNMIEKAAGGHKDARPVTVRVLRCAFDEGLLAGLREGQRLVNAIMAPQ